MCWSPVPRMARGRNVRSTAPRWVGKNCRNHRCSRGAGDVGSGFLESADPMASFTSASRKTSGLRRRHTQRLSSTSMPLQASFSLQDLKLFGPTPTRFQAGVGFTPPTESATAWSFWIADRSSMSQEWLLWDNIRRHRRISAHTASPSDTVVADPPMSGVTASPPRARTRSTAASTAGAAAVSPRCSSIMLAVQI